MLLWHGSRTTNFAGIISQGLRIAPPEAPVTGYMFGKGIYFADMVSKSANYCQTSRSNNTGLLMVSITMENLKFVSFVTLCCRWDCKSTLLQHLIKLSCTLVLPRATIDDMIRISKTAKRYINYGDKIHFLM